MTRHTGVIVALGNKDFFWISSPTAGRVFGGASQLLGLTVIGLRLGMTVTFTLAVDYRGRKEAQAVRLSSAAQHGASL